jgi:hypothetical protein
MFLFWRIIMSYAPTSPVTGGAQTGFTSPTYTIAADVAPDVNGKQHAVTALGGTQAGVTAHTVQSPFTATFVRPKTFKSLSVVDPVTGQLRSVPKNSWKFIVRKGATPLAGQTPSVLIATLSVDVPAGSDTADPANIRAAISLLVGLLNQQSAGIGDSLVTGLAF